MSNPISSGAAPTSIKVGKGTWGLLAAAALGFTAWRANDTYQGHRIISNQRIAANKYRNEMEDIKYDQGRYSGASGMDGLAGRFHQWVTLGPLQIRQHWQNFKIRVSSLFNNVVFPNLIPLGVGLASLYGAIGHKQMSQYGSQLAKWWNQSGFFKNYFNPTMKAVGGNLFGWLTSGLANVLRFTFKSPGHFAVASGLGLVGTFFLKRFNDAYNGNAQSEYFRDDFRPRY